CNSSASSPRRRRPLSLDLNSPADDQVGTAASKIVSDRRWFTTTRAGVRETPMKLMKAAYGGDPTQVNTT
ncbi:MAG TPA: hypothetical protein VGJ95_11010, partial [Pseudonocardiaceae bacterium]